jgi:hypothetical protein
MNNVGTKVLLKAVFISIAIACEQALKFQREFKESLFAG